MPSVKMTSAWVWIVGLFPGGKFARGVAAVAGGTAIGQAVPVLASPLLTRIYSPDDFGTLAVFAAILAMTAVVANLRYNMAIPLPDNDTAAADILVLCLGIVFVVAGLTALVFGVLDQQIAVWTNAPALQPYYWLLPIGVLSVGIYQTLKNWAIRQKKFVHLGLTKVSQGLGMVAIQLGLGMLQFIPLGLILGQVVGQAAGGSTLATLAWRKDSAAIKGVSYGGMWRAAKRYYRFPIYYAPAALATTAWLQLPALVLAAFYGPEVAGWYVLGTLVLGVPVSLLGDAVGQVYLGEAAKLLRERPEALHRFFVSTSIRLFALGVVPIGLIGLSGPDLFEFVFGPSWLEAGLFVQVLAPLYILRFTVAPVSQTLSVLLERQDLFFIVSVVRIVLNIGLLLAACWLGAAPAVALAVYSGSMVAMYLGFILLILFEFQRRAVKSVQS